MSEQASQLQPAVPMLAMSPTSLAAALDISVAKVHAMNASGELGPVPLELGNRCPRWSKTEIDAWLLAGAPPRSQWVQIRDAAMKRYA